MKNNALRITILILILFTTINLSAQKVNFDYIRTIGHYDHQPVISIDQDIDGRLWFASNNELFCYDSYRITNVSRDFDKNIAPIYGNKQIKSNSLGHICIMYDSFLQLYDPFKKRFLRFNNSKLSFNLEGKKVLSIEKKFLLLGKDELFILEYHNNSYTTKKILTRKQFYNIVQIANDNFIFCSELGIESIKINNSKVSVTSKIPYPFPDFLNNGVTTFAADPLAYWIGTMHNGIYKYNIGTNSWQNFNITNSNILSNDIKTIFASSLNKIWIGSAGGISIYTGSNKFDNYQQNDNLPNSLSHESIRDIYEDREGIIWIGTYFGGINYVLPQSNPINNINKFSPPGYNLSSNSTKGFLEFDDHYWFATEYGGINVTNKITYKTNLLEYYPSTRNIRGVYKQGSKVYIAESGTGYSTIDLNSKSVTHHLLSSKLDDPINLMYWMAVDPLGNKYLSTNKGPFLQDNDGKITPIPEIRFSMWVYFNIDYNGKVYAQSFKDLYVKEHYSEKFKKINCPPIRDYYIDEEDKVWIVSENKIYRLLSNDKFELIAELKDIFPTRLIVNDNFIYLTSFNGLIQFNKLSKNYVIYNKDDGFKHNNLTNFRLSFNSRKEVVIIGPLGIYILDPSRLSYNSEIPKPYLTDIIINNDYSVLNRAKKISDYEISIELKHDEKSVNIYFGSNNLIKPLKNKYKYKLSGLNDDWIISSSPYIQYTNLPYGNNTLALFTQNNDGIWSVEPFIFEIYVNRPFWLSWIAIFIYLSIIITIIYFLYKLTLDRRVLMVSKIEQAEKLEFFNHISHEIRTPLTLIITPLDEILQLSSSNPLLQRKIVRLRNNANKLLKLTTDLLDFRKMDAQKYTIQRSQIDFKKYVQDIFFLFYDYAKSKDLNFYIKRLDDVGLIAIDVFQFDKVLFNLLSNAIKFTQEGGNIYLELIDNEESFELRIVDDGIGIDKESTFKVFENYFTEPNNNNNVLSTGIGLALAKKIIHLHGGNIWNEQIIEDENKKTKFAIILNKVDGSAFPIYHNEEKINSLHQQLVQDTNLIMQSILIIDDDREILQLLKDIFIDDYKILTAQNANEGISMAREFIPDLIISDIMMAGKSGIELCAELRQDLITNFIPIILLTAASDDTYRYEALNKGANIYITKPFDISHLKLSVSNLISLKNKSVSYHGNFDKSQILKDNKMFIDKLDAVIEKALLNENLDVDHIAREMGVSVATLYRRMKSVTDLSINNYIKIFKLNKAKDLLFGNMNINEIAYEVGFLDRKYFSKEFKKHFGYTPSEFKNKYKPKQ